MGYEPGLELKYQPIRRQDLISPQSEAVTFGNQPYISEEQLLEAQRRPWEAYNEQRLYQEYLNRQDALAEEGYRMAKRQGQVDLGLRGVGLGIQSADTLKKYGPNVFKAITKPFQSAQPVVDTAGQGMGLQTTGGQVTSEIGLEPGKTLATEGDSLFTATTDFLGEHSRGYVPGLKDIGGIEGGLLKGGLAAGTSYLAERTGLTEGVRDAADKIGIGGGKKEWDLAASSLAAFAFGGPVGLGVNLAVEGIKSLF